MITAEMIAPCGLDCSLCKRALAEANPCPGCHGPNENKPEFCAERCGIILCRKRIERAYQYCDECPDYPCADVMEKETRYTSKYGHVRNAVISSLSIQVSAADAVNNTALRLCR